MYCLLLVISDIALLPSSATGGGRKATNQFVCKHDTNKPIQYAFACFGFTTKTNGERGSPLQTINHFYLIKIYVFKQIVSSNRRIISAPITQKIRASKQCSDFFTTIKVQLKSKSDCTNSDYAVNCCDFCKVICTGACNINNCVSIVATAL